MPILKRTFQAEEDLLEIWAFIASDSPKAADKVIRDLDARSQELLTHPKLGPVRDDIADGLRYLVVGSYLIMYRIDEPDIEIVRYLHGARNLLTIF